MTISIGAIFHQPDNSTRQVFLYNKWTPDLIYRDICALANSQRGQCGYVLIGAGEDEHTPPNGLTALQIATIKKEMTIYNKLIKPSYEPELYIRGTDEKPIAMILIRPSDKGPYVVPEKVSEGATNYKRYLLLHDGIIAT